MNVVQTARGDATLRARQLWVALGLVVAFASRALAIGQAPFVTTTAGGGAFVLAQDQGSAPIWVDPGDWPGVVRVAGDLQADVERVTGLKPLFLTTTPATLPRTVVIVGTIGRSPLITRLVDARKIDVTGVAGRWESFVVQTVTDPMPGVAQALVIAGSDKRGTIYGVYELSEQIGVSPWYWWSDTTPERRTALFVKAGRYVTGEPSVKYRGIFLNDERPDLDYWVRATYGERPTPGGGTGTVANFNSKFYTRLFEVILRMRGNYLWPAMWNNAFAEDDPDNARLADEYGIVMGTSHQEPMLRAQKEWDWHLRAQFGNWNFATHPNEMLDFWRGAVKERKGYENIFTIGLRGENDTAMAQGQAANMALLDVIVAGQRKIIAEEIRADVTQVPQLWCLYKEVQGYYENGLRVPDDVTLLWAEDNWGNVRRLPTADERKRTGGAGIYYHFDYHGGPRSYQWVNTNPIAKIWDQMSLAKQYGADRVWIVNVGHFKGYELPTEYFLSLAWNTNQWTGENLREYTRLWATREFGAAYGAEAAEILAGYTRINGRRKPELLAPGTYSLTQAREAERVVEEFNGLTARAEALFNKLPAAKRAAFYQLVLFPTKASANVNELYVTAAKNALYATQGRASTNDMAARTRELFQIDADLMKQYNTVFAGGRWNHFMDQSHIGYTTWQDPPQNSLAAVPLKEIVVPEPAALGVAIDGSRAAWPGSADAATLPVFDAINQQRSYIEVFNRGRTPFAFAATTSAPWITLSQTRGQVTQDSRVWVTVDWSRAPMGLADGAVTIGGAGSSVTVAVRAHKPAGVTRESLEGFAEGAGIVSIEAEHVVRSVLTSSLSWTRIEDYGRTLSGMRATSPVDVAGLTPNKDAPALEYRLYLHEPGPVKARLTVAPTLNFAPGRGLRVAVAFDDEAPQVLTIVPPNFSAQNGNREWEESVRNEARSVTSSHTIATIGYHTLRVWMVDPGVVLEKILVTTAAGAADETYLGPPEGFHRGIRYSNDYTRGGERRQ